MSATAKRRAAAQPAGASTLEVLVAAALLAVFSTLAHSFARSCFRSAAALQARADAAESAYLALSLLVGELRQAGYSASGNLIGAIASAEDSRLRFAADFDGDGDTDDANENVSYGSDAARGTLTRASGSGSPQPVIDHVPPTGLRFAYFDARGQQLFPGPDGLDAQQRSAVRRIDVRIEVEEPNPDPALRAPIKAAAATSVTLRNAGLP